MDDPASAWKDIAMNALGEGESNDENGDDGLVGVDWLAASINSREIPGGCDRRTHSRATGKEVLPNRVRPVSSSQLHLYILMAPSLSDFTADDFLEPLGEETLVENSTHSHAIEDAQVGL